MNEFVLLVAEAEGRKLEMIAPVELAVEKLEQFAEHLDNEFCWSATPVDTIDLRKAAS